MSDKKQTVDLGLLEEDDEFEEFPAEGKESTWKVVSLFGALPVVGRDAGIFASTGPRCGDSASRVSISITVVIDSLNCYNVKRKKETRRNKYKLHCHSFTSLYS